MRWPCVGRSAGVNESPSKGRQRSAQEWFYLRVFLPPLEASHNVGSMLFHSGWPERFPGLLSNKPGRHERREQQKPDSSRLLFPHNQRLSKWQQRPSCCDFRNRAKGENRKELPSRSPWMTIQHIDGAATTAPQPHTQTAFLTGKSSGEHSKRASRPISARKRHLPAAKHQNSRCRT